MSPPTSGSSKLPATPYRKPRANVYTMMLLVALLALVIGTVFLYLEVKRYGDQPFSGALRPGGTGIFPVLVADAGTTPMLALAIPSASL